MIAVGSPLSVEQVKAGFQPFKNQVVAAIIYQGGRFLMGKRSSSKKIVAGFDTQGNTTRIHWWTVNIISGTSHLKNDEHYCSENFFKYGNIAGTVIFESQQSSG